MSGRTRFFVILLVVALIALTVTAVYAGSFSFLNDAVQIVGHPCSSGCTLSVGYGVGV